MCGSAVGTGGGPDDGDPEGVATGEPKRDDDGAGTDELIGGELAAAAEDDVAGALGGELAKAVGLATCGDVDVHALKHRTTPTPSAATQRIRGITKAACWGRRRTPRRIRSATRRRWPSGTRSACPFRRPSR
jgi:hypothetical protein